MPPGVREIVGDRRRLTESADDLRTLAPEVVVDRLTDSKADRMEFQHEWREATLLLAGLSDAGANCRPKRP